MLKKDLSDLRISLKQRYRNSQQLANWLNQQDLENEDLVALKKHADTYFRLQKRLGLKEQFVYTLAKGQSLSVTKELLYLIDE